MEGNRAIQDRCLLLAVTARRECGRIHLPALGTELTVLTQEPAYAVGVKVESTFKGRCQFASAKRSVRHLAARDTVAPAIEKRRTRPVGLLPHALQWSLPLTDTSLILVKPRTVNVLQSHFTDRVVVTVPKQGSRLQPQAREQSVWCTDHTALRTACRSSKDLGSGSHRAGFTRWIYRRLKFQRWCMKNGHSCTQVHHVDAQVQPTSCVLIKAMVAQISSLTQGDSDSSLEREIRQWIFHSPQASQGNIAAGLLKGERNTCPLLLTVAVVHRGYFGRALPCEPGDRASPEYQKKQFQDGPEQAPRRRHFSETLWHEELFSMGKAWKNRRERSTGWIVK